MSKKHCSTCVHCTLFRDHGASIPACAMDMDLANAIRRYESGYCAFYFSRAMAVMHSDFIPSVEGVEFGISKLVRPAPFVNDGFMMLIHPECDSLIFHNASDQEAPDAE